MDQLRNILPFDSPHFKWTSSESSPLSATSVDDSLMIYGSDPQIRTNLLFQAAISHISQGSHVTFICSQPLPQLPLHVHAMPRPQPQVMAMLKMLYISNYSDLVKFLASIHSLIVLPEVLILDDLTGYTTDIQNEASEVHAAARLCALLKDVLHFLHAKQGIGKMYTSADSNQQMVNSVYGRFFQNMAAVEEVEDSNLFILNVERNHKKPDRKYRCHMTVDADSCLRLVKVQCSEPKPS